MGMLSEPDWKPFRNDSGETIPACGLLMASEVVLRGTDGKPILKAVEPFLCPMQSLWVNSLAEVKPGKYGSCFQADICYVRFDPSDGAPEVNEPWGVKEGGLILRKGYGGFVVLQPPTERTAETVLVRRVDHHVYQGELAGDIDAPADSDEAWEDPPVADVNVFAKSSRTTSDDPRLLSQTQFVAKDCVNRDTSLEGVAGSYCLIAWIDGTWVFIWVGCP